MLPACPRLRGPWAPPGGLVMQRHGAGLDGAWGARASPRVTSPVRAERKRSSGGGRMAAVASAASGLQLPTFAAARALVKPGSCLSVGPHRRHVALAPRFLGRKRSGLREQLDRELLRYSESLRGVPVAYDNLRLVGELGDIHDDQGHVHVHIEADFVIFCPERGQKLVGTINKVAPSHLGCLVHGCFNASIPKPEHMPLEQWQGLHFRVGDELEFEVARLDSDAAGVFCIRGMLLMDSLPPALPNGSSDVGNETESGAGGERPKKKSKKAKPPPMDCDPTPATRPPDVAEAAETDPQAPEVRNGLCEEQEPRAKKKHHREKLEQDPLWHASDSSGYQSDPQKKKRKRKKHSEESEGPGTPEEPRPRKKKKKEKE